MMKEAETEAARTERELSECNEEIVEDDKTKQVYVYMHVCVMFKLLRLLFAQYS
jgi:hypothetical protein